MKKAAIILTLCSSFAFGFIFSPAQSDNHRVANVDKAENQAVAVIYPSLSLGIIYPSL